MVQTQSVSIGVGETWSTFTSEKNTGRAVGAVIDPERKRTEGKEYSLDDHAPSFTSSRPPRFCSSPCGHWREFGSGGEHRHDRPYANCTVTIETDPYSASSINHREEEEEKEGSEGDELPTFHRGSVKSRAKKRASIARLAPRPFPMQFVTEPPVCPCASRLREMGEARYDDGNGDGDMVEIVDVFTTTRGPSPPRSPTPSPLAGPATLVKSRQSSGFPTSPTKSKPQTDSEPHEGRKQRRQASSDWDTRVSGNEKDGILKSPRKSAAHSSPRHIPRACGRAPSSAPGSTPHANNDIWWTGDAEGCNMSDSRGPEPEDSGSMQIDDRVGRKAQPSDASAIYISSGSEGAMQDSASMTAEAADRRL